MTPPRLGKWIEFGGGHGQTANRALEKFRLVELRRLGGEEMKEVLAAAMAALALLFGVTSATANADPSEYLQQVQKKLPAVYDEYGPQALVTEGWRICGWEALHVDFSDEVDQIVSDLPMSRQSAIQLSVLTIYLDC